jgi:helix-turn-helix protein
MTGSPAIRARELWHYIEHLHAVIYFHSDCGAALASIGLRDFWAGYFANRVAPLGPVGPGTVEATFFNFSPVMIEPWFPSVWHAASPDLVVKTRREAAARVLDSVLTTTAKVERINELLSAAEQAAPVSGRPLFGANRDLPRPDKPLERLWQLCTSLREHRGDGHVAALTALGLSGCQPHCLAAAGNGVPVRMFLLKRGWTEAEWQEASAQLLEQGLLDKEGALTSAGLQTQSWLETTTDDLAAKAYEGLGRSGVEELLDTLGPMALEISKAGIIRFPNTMGLPALDDAGA